jgi:hypothetical protein
MRDKFSDNILNTDSVPERNQEPTEEGKIKLLDVVALTQDVPEHNLKRGEVGTVVEILANGEAFEVEFSDDNGQMYKCLSFPESQLRVLRQESVRTRRNHLMSNNSELLHMHAAAAEKHLELKKHWDSVTQTLDNRYKSEVERIIRVTESIHISGEYLYRGEDRNYECVSSSMFRMTRPLVKLIEHLPQLVSERHTLTLSGSTDGSSDKLAVRIHSVNLDEFEEYGRLPIHRRQLLENPDLLMEAAEKEFDFEFRSRSNRIYELEESDTQSEIQHHLGKTRRIDMTKCPYKALFFSCYGGGNHDGRIVFFNSDELEAHGELIYPEYIDKTRFKNQESVFFIPKGGYIKPSNANVIIIPKHLKIPILLWLDENKSISNRTMYNDTLGLIENQKTLEKYYEAYAKGMFSQVEQSLDNYQETIEKLNEAIDIIPLIIDIEENKKYNFLNRDHLTNDSLNLHNIDRDNIGRSYTPAPYFLYFSRALTRINKSTSNKKVDTAEIKLALDDLMYARYMTQFSTFCIKSYSDEICLHEGVCYMLLGELEKSKQKFVEALEISEEFGTSSRDNIMFYYKQLEDQGLIG